MTKENTAGRNEEQDEFVEELKPGTELLHGQYTISRFLNHGGFGITYLAKDSLERDVVIKECFPGAFCRRSRTIVGARSRAHQNEFKSIVKLFIQEARSLSKLVHPNIVGVHQVFEDNDTAYMAIDYIDGRDMLDILEDKNVTLEPSDIVSMTEKLLSAVGFIHENNMLHRDISPDNILLNPEGEPILIDFGAAREQASKTSRALSALRVVKDGYSPQEFYITGSEQGPWSDLYALGASLFHIISGEAPADSQTRLAAIAEGRDDPYNKLAGRFDGYPYGFLEAIDRAMEAVPKRRTQTAAEWLAMFDNTKPRLAVVDSDPADTITEILRESTPDTAPAKGGSAGKDVDVSAISKMVEDNQRARDEWEANAKVAKTARGSGERKKGGMGPIILGGGLLVAGAVAFAVMNMGGDPETTTQTETATSVVPSVAESPSTTLADNQPETSETATRQTTTTEQRQTSATPEPVIAESPTVEVASSESPAASEESEIAGQTVEEPVVSTTATTSSDAVVVVEEETAAEVATEEETVVASTEAPAVEEESTTVAVEESTTEVSATETDTASSSSATSTPEPVIEATPTPSVTEDASVATAAEELTVSRNQVSFGHWDISMPFESEPRELNGENLALITRVPSNTQREISGEWIDQGVTIYSVNGTPLRPGAGIETLILNDLQVDPDGFTRAIVQYKPRGDRDAQLGLLAVQVVRNLGLENGVLMHTEHDGAAWVTSVISVQEQLPNGLQRGDVIVRESQTGRTVRSETTIEEILRLLVSGGYVEANFTVERGAESVEVTMPLNLE